MNRQVTLLLLLITLASCNKIYNVHFHGHITNGCTGMPVANVPIEIYRDYDTGTEQREQVGTATTDANGYYEFIADVSTRGAFNYYLIFSGAEVTHTENATSDSKDVLMDGITYSMEPVNFHIKNTNPFDSYDS